MTVIRAAGPLCELGEGPFRTSAGALHWVDIPAGALYSAGLREDVLGVPAVVVRVDETLGAAAEASGGGYLLACARDLVRVDSEGTLGARRPIVPVDVASRLNDGAVDPAGRYLVGTLALDGRRGQERLLQLDTDGSVAVLDDDLTLSNGLAWSPEGDVLYSIDSIPGTVWQRSYDPDTGRTGPRSALVRYDDEIPDGLAVDARGNLWVAMWAQGCVRCYDAAGRPLDEVRIAVPSTTSVAFAGDDLATMVITTARLPVGDEPLHPDAGRLHILRPGVVGVAGRAWAPSFG